MEYSRPERNLEWAFDASFRDRTDADLDSRFAGVLYRRNESCTTTF